MNLRTTASRPKGGIFYGWYIIGVIMAGGFLGSGLSQLFMGIMLKPMTEDLGWTRTATSGAITTGTVVAGLLSPPFGRLTDRYGPRLLMPLGALVAVMAYLGMAYTRELWHFYLAYVVGRSLSSVCLGGVVPMTAAANWFRRMRGRALGLVAMSVPLGGAALVLVGQYVTSAYGWRSVFLVFAASCLALVVIPAAVILRRRPEDLGLLPDGDTVASDEAAAPNRGAQAKAAEGEEVNWTLAEAVRTPSLWLLIFGLVVGTLANGAISFHQVAYYTDVGVGGGIAALSLSLYGFSGAVANAVWGFLTERISERLCAAGAMFLAAAAVCFLLFVSSAPMALTFSVLFGLAARGEASLVMIIIAQYYGRESYGTISGFITPFQMVALGLGPLVASLSYDFTGSYTLVFTLFIGSYLISAIALFLARKPQPPTRLALRPSAVSYS